MLEVPSYKKSIKQNLFDFKVDGKKYSIPKLDHLPVRYTTRLQALSSELGEGGDASAVSNEAAAEFMNVITEVIDKFCPDVLDAVDLTGLQTIMEAWMAAGETSPGE